MGSGERSGSTRTRLRSATSTTKVAITVIILRISDKDDKLPLIPADNVLTLLDKPTPIDSHHHHPSPTSPSPSVGTSRGVLGIAFPRFPKTY